MNSAFDDFARFHRPAGQIFQRFMHLQVEFFKSSQCDDFSSTLGSTHPSRNVEDFACV